ncbi:hypothetical protein ACLQ3B_00920 [Micromonospora sp. DT53]|uniref:hypothetical protein n=1 Tax=Micromonospora sp. DT53 TaxID=3393444 RepID=UPI003CE9206C
MRHRLRQVALVLLGAALFGTVGLSLGSWYAGRGTTPVRFDQARRMAAELLPGSEPVATGEGVVPTWQGLLAHGLTEPAWTIWPALAPVLVPVALVLLWAGVIFYPGRREPSRASTPSASQP